MNPLLAAAALACGHARAAASPPPPEPVPQMEIARLNGRVEIETPGQAESVAGQKLPFLRQGSVVRVQSGSAAFASDFHAVVRVGKGDAFHYTAREGSLRIAAVESTPKTIEVVVGDRVFTLRRGGALSVTRTAPGEMTVSAEEAGPRPAISGVREPSHPDRDLVRAGDKPLRPGSKVLVAVPDEVEFGAPAISPAAVAVSRRGLSAFTAQAEWPTQTAKADRDDLARRVMSPWPRVPRRMAENLMAKYGPPDAADPDRLVWNSVGYWKRATVYRSAAGREDFLEQTIDYKTTPAQRAELAKMDIGLTTDPAGLEVSATSEAESTNFLAVNVAAEVARGSRTPADGRDFYVKTLRLANSGKDSLYLQGLLFLP